MPRDDVNGQNRQIMTKAKRDYSIMTESRKNLENPLFVNTSLNETVCIVECYLDGAQNIRQWSPSKLPKSFQVSSGNATKTTMRSENTRREIDAYDRGSDVTREV